MKHAALPGSESHVDLDKNRSDPLNSSAQSVPPMPALTSQLRRLVDIARQADVDRGLYRVLPLLALPILSACGGSGSTQPRPTPPPTNNNPVAAGDNAIELDEGATYVLTASDLSATDPDMDDGPDELTWRVTEATDNGHLALSSAPGIAVSSFTEAQVADGDVVYVHDGGETTSDSFMVQVEDDGRPELKAGAVTVDVAVAPVNDPATTSGDLAISVVRGASSMLNPADISVEDPDDGPAALTWRVTTTPGNGHLALSSAPGTAITSFTQAQVAAGDVIYVHDGGQTAADSFAVQVEDDGTPALTAPAVTVDVTITAGDQAPGQTTLSGPGTVAGDAAAGDDIGTLSATDLDVGDGMPAFSIVSVRGEDGSTVIATHLIATHPFAIANGVLEIAAGATASQLALLAGNARLTLTVRAADADDANLFTDTDLVIFVVAEQGGTDAADTLDGVDNQADALRGLAGNDVLDGMGGPDILDGGRDDDTLSGGTGADVFVYRFNSTSGGLPNSWNDGDLQSPNADGSDRILDFNRGEGDRLLFVDENTGSNKIDTLAEFKAAFDLATDPFLATRGVTRDGVEFISMEFGAPDQGADPVSGQHVLTIFSTAAISSDLFDMNTGQFNDVDAFIEALGGADALQFG